MVDVAPWMVAEILLIVVAFGLFLLAITGNLQWLADTLGPIFGIKGQATYYESVSYHSTDALVCAINNVARGGGDPCIRDFKSSVLESNIILGWLGGAGPGLIGNGKITGNAAEGQPLSIFNKTGSGEKTFAQVSPTDKVSLDCVTNFPEFEYDPGWVPASVFFTFKDGEWMWKSPDSGVNEYKQLTPISKSGLSAQVLLKMDAIFTDVIFTGNKINFDGIMRNYNSYLMGKDILKNALFYNKFGLNGENYGGDDKIIVTFKDGGSKTFDTSNYLDMDKVSELGSVTCNVKNFRMPQDVQGAEEWIAGFGDPQFLVFYQKFPAGEEAAWSGYEEWFKGAVQLMFLTECAAGIIGTGFKAVKSVAHPVASISKIKPFFDKVRGLKDAAAGGAREAASAMKVAGKTIALDVRRFIAARGLLTTRELAEYMWYTIKNDASAAASYARRLGFAKKLGPLAGITVAEGTTAGVSAYFLQLTDTMYGKYFDRPGKMVLQKPTEVLKEIDTQSLVIPSSFSNPVETKGTVILDKAGSLQTHSTFYLASPCHTDLTVSKSEVKCGTYGYNLEDGSVDCVDVKILEGNNDVIPCGLDERFSEKTGKETYDTLLRNLKSTERKFVEYSQDITKTYVDSYEETFEDTNDNPNQDVYFNCRQSGSDSICKYCDASCTKGIRSEDLILARTQEHDLANLGLYYYNCYLNSYNGLGTTLGVTGKGLAETKEKSIEIIANAISDCLQKLKRGEQGVCSTINPKNAVVDDVFGIRKSDVEIWLREKSKVSYDDIKLIDWTIEPVTKDSPVFKIESSNDWNRIIIVYDTSSNQGRPRIGWVKASNDNEARDKCLQNYFVKSEMESIGNSVCSCPYYSFNKVYLPFMESNDVIPYLTNIHYVGSAAPGAGFEQEFIPGKRKRFYADLYYGSEKVNSIRPIEMYCAKEKSEFLESDVMLCTIRLYDISSKSEWSKLREKVQYNTITIELELKLQTNEIYLQRYTIGADTEGIFDTLIRYNYIDSGIDGSWDSVLIKYGKFMSDNTFKMILGNEGGKVNSILSQECKIPAIIVKPDLDSMKKYKDKYGEKYNFCMTRSDQKIQLVITGGMIVLDASGKVLSAATTNPLPLVAATAISCGLSYASMQITLKNWPETILE